MRFLRRNMAHSSQEAIDMNPNMLLSLCAYNTYANRLVLDTMKRMSAEELTRQSSPSHGTAQALLMHMLGTELFFFKLCQGQTLPVPTGDVPTLAQLYDAVNLYSKEEETFIQSLDEAGLEREVSFPIAQRTFHLPVWQLLTQAFMHATHHRGELSIVLTQLGYPLPTLDIIIPFIQQSGQEWPFQ
jgi:uncharacterized damage-inducible protein DinB